MSLFCQNYKEKMGRKFRKKKLAEKIKKKIGQFDKIWTKLKSFCCESFEKTTTKSGTRNDLEICEAFKAICTSDFFGVGVVYRSSFNIPPYNEQQMNLLKPARPSLLHLFIGKYVYITKQK